MPVITTAPHIQIFPHNRFHILELHDKIHSLCHKEWKIVLLKDPENWDHPISQFIAYSKKPYLNLGYLRLILSKDYLEIYFLQPPLGPISSPKIISFLFARFITLLKYNFKSDIKNISILNFEQNFGYIPQYTYPHLEILIKPHYKPTEVYWDILTDIKAIFNQFPLSKNIDFNLRARTESIELSFCSKRKLNADIKAEISHLLILSLFFLFPKIEVIEAIQAFNL